MKSPREQGWASLQILGVRVDCVDFQQTLDAISGWIAQSQAEEKARSSEKPERTSPPADNRSEDDISGRQTRSSRLTPHASPFPRQVCTVNPEFIMTARRHPAFAQALAAADLCTPDGVGVLWAARLAGVRLNERVTGSDGIHRICEQAALQGWRVFFLGAAPRRSRPRRRRAYPPLPRPARRRNVRRLARGVRLAADPPAPRQRARRSALRRLRPSPPGHLDSPTQRGVAGRRRPRHRRRLRLRRRHHPPAPRTGCAASASNGYTASPANPGAGAAWPPCPSSRCWYCWSACDEERSHPDYVPCPHS